MSTVTPLYPSPGDPSNAAAAIEQWVPRANGPDLAVRVYGRRGKSATALVVHFHGGAFVAGGLDQGEPMARLLLAAGAVVVSVAYPLACDAPFPAAAEAGHEVLEWAYRRRRSLAGADTRLWVAGEEAGGNLAAAMALMARDRHSPPLAGQILFSPMLNPCIATASLREAQAGPVGCIWADGWHAYLAGAGDTLHPYAAPGLAERLTGLVPAWLFTAEDDPLRDETRSYAERLAAAGVPVKLQVLSAPTGWPCTMVQPGASTQPWMAALLAPVQALLSAAAGQGGPSAAPSAGPSAGEPSGN